MEMIISIILGLWIMLAGVLCYLNYKKDVSSFMCDKKSKE